MELIAWNFSHFFLLYRKIQSALSSLHQELLLILLSFITHVTKIRAFRAPGMVVSFRELGW